MRPLFVHEMFDGVAASRADAIAISGPGDALTYGALRAWSNSIAWRLIDAGARPGAIVYIAVDSRYAVIASMIGALDAGVVFVPIDHTQPTERLRQLAAQVPPAFVLTETELADAMAERLGAPIIIVDSERNKIEPPARVSREPDDMAYVYFTSGSTGKPKAIAGRLKSIDHFIRWEIDTFGITEETVVSQLTSPVFDAFLRDTFVPLCAGGQLKLPDSRETALDPARLRSWLNEAGVGLIHTVPSLYRTLLSVALQAEDFPSLRHVLLAGEPLLSSDVKRWYDLFGERIRLVNLYGPSETTMVKLFHPVVPADADKRSIPVGQAMVGARALVLDDSGQPAAPGAIGEIYIRTPYRTLGYYGDPEATAKAFVVNPLSDDPTDIVYRTGDLARLLPDGNIEFLGRRDQQVKIRGVRVELEEIENAILATNLVSETAVAAVADRFGTLYLCAYVTGVAGKADQVDELRRALAEKLPEHLVPKTIVPLETLPRTATGKIDRKALPNPDELRLRSAADVAPPGNETAARIAAVFGEVLGIEGVGGQEDFFQLGGHSLLAMHVLSRLSEAFNVELPLVILFEKPTADELSVVVLELQSKPAPAAVAGLSAISVSDQVKQLSDADVDSLLEGIVGVELKVS